MPNDSHTIKDRHYHDVIGSEYHSIVVEPREAANQVLFREISRRIPEGRSMLDLGCGTGHMLLRFGSRFNSLVGIDHSAAMLKAASTNLDKAGLVADLRRADVVEFIDSDSTKYDLVSCVGFLHHLRPKQISFALHRIADLIQPDGLLILAEPIEVDLSTLPPEIAEWNANSVAAKQVYSNHAEEPDEAPIPQDLLLEAIADAELELVTESRSWEVFPHHEPPTTEDRDAIERFSRVHGKNGNVYAVLARKQSSARQ